MKRKRTRALIIKEVLQIIRDPSALLIAFVIPLLLLFIFGYGINLDSNQIRMGIVLESQSPDTEEVAQAFLRSPFLNSKLSYARPDLYKSLITGKLRGIVVIPQDFAIDNFIQRSVQIITDGSEPNIASFAENYARGVLQTWLTYHREDVGVKHLKAPVSVESRFWYNPELKSHHFLVPSSIAMIMTLIGTMLTGLVIAREWERGTMEAMMATPISISEFLLGKLVPYFVLGMGSMVMCTLVAVFLYNVPFRGSILALALLSSIFLWAALGQGLLISSLAKDQFVASQITLMSAFLPAFMLSGFIFEISSMPKFVQAITYIVSARYFVNSLHTIFLAGDVWPLFLKNILGMLTIGSIFYLILLYKIKKRLD